MAAKRPRGGGYYNATLAVAGAAVPIPVAASGFIIHCSAACYVGVGTSATLLTFNTTNYGVVGPLMQQEFTHGAGETHVHVAPVAGTAAVSIAFV